MTRVAAVLISFAAVTMAARPVAAQPAVTYSRDVAPILFAKCGVCHRPTGAAPFSLLTYAVARAHATQIATVTRTGYMPPYPADTEYGGEFVGQPHLTAAELETLQRWVAEGAAEGNPRDLPPIPVWTDGWQLGKPDLIVRPASYTLQADGTDVFRIFVVRLPVDGLKYVRGMEFNPGNARIVHHANIRIDRTTTSRAFDDADPAPGYEGLIANSAVYPEGHFLGWTPGQVPPLLPKGSAWRLYPGTDLIVELHMQPSGREEVVQPTIGFYFGSDPPEQTPAMLRLGRQSIDIPPGEKNYVITDSFVTPVDVDVQAVQPHAHYRAKEIVGFAELPDGSLRPLIHIRNWDFRWQHVYRYVTPFWLPKGTRLQMRYTYDNSAENPRNPMRPPTRVLWGQRSADEMGDLGSQAHRLKSVRRVAIGFTRSSALAAITAISVCGQLSHQDRFMWRCDRLHRPGAARFIHGPVTPDGKQDPSELPRQGEDRDSLAPSLGASTRSNLWRSRTSSRSRSWPSREGS